MQVKGKMIRARVKPYLVKGPGEKNEDARKCFKER